MNLNVAVAPGAEVQESEFRYSSMSASRFVLRRHIASGRYEMDGSLSSIETVRPPETGVSVEGVLVEGVLVEGVVGVESGDVVEPDGGSLVPFTETYLRAARERVLGAKR